MRIMIHAPYPEMPTGYGNQVKVWAPRLAKAGHEVAISCTAGVVRHNTTWQGMKVYGRSPYTDMAEDLVRFSYDDFGADLIITLCCPWKLHGYVWRDMRTIHLMPVDRDPLGVPDTELLTEGAGTPGAVSRFGERVLRAKGFDPLYLPHAVDTGAWKPTGRRAKMRDQNGLADLFVVGMNAANVDPDDRKSFGETFRAFAAFHAKHPKSLLTVHAARTAPDGLNLDALAAHVGITGSVLYTNQYQLAAAGASQEDLAAWYEMCDVTVLCSKGEGYGIPLAESQAMGTPVITMGWSTGPELAGPGWTVEGQPLWARGHRADWHTPFIASIEHALEEAAESAADRRKAARRFAVDHLDADKAWEAHWAPVMAGLDD